MSFFIDDDEIFIVLQPSIISEKLDLPAKRANVKLNNEKIEKETKIVMKGVKEGLKIMLKNRKS